MMREPIDLPPIVSVELIQISDKTNIPFAPKARKIIEETKKKEERVVSEQAPPAAKAKEKPDRIPLPDEKKEKKQLVKKKQNPEEVKPEIRQSSEFEKKDIIDTNQIAALIDKAKEIEANMRENQEKIKKIQAEGMSGGGKVKIIMNGEGEIVNISISPRVDPEGNRQGLVVAVEDISDISKVKNTFKRYVSKQVVDELLDNDAKLNLGGEQREITILFTDIRGFTSMSERMQPEIVVSTLNEYFSEMIDIVFKHNGTLDKIIGDELMLSLIHI